MDKFNSMHYMDRTEEKPLSHNAMFSDVCHSDTFICPGFDPQSWHYVHGGVPLGKAHFLAKYWFVYPGIMKK